MKQAQLSTNEKVDDIIHIFRQDKKKFCVDKGFTYLDWPLITIERMCSNRGTFL